jgi:hypothetical protein
MADRESVRWRDHYNILAPEDTDSLDTNSAVLEFRGGLPKEQAEAKAHTNYLRNHALDAAAYHYLGMRAAVAAQHIPAAKQHGQAYILAMRHLGLGPTDAPPKEVLDRIQDFEKSPYKFSAHKADEFFTPQLPEIEPEDKEKAKTQELLTALKGLGKPSAAS